MGKDADLAASLLSTAKIIPKIQGDPGMGKTTLPMHFLLAGARRGESCLYVTFSETRDELFAVAESHGWELDGIDVFDLSNFAQQLTRAPGPALSRIRGADTFFSGWPFLFFWPSKDTVPDTSLVRHNLSDWSQIKT